ncbi:membrane-bound lytic murein transglycosylase B [Vibrio cholerae]|nr:membrane-bound lytic murein transglycosylase B [Vibrio cholerae]
MKIPKGFDHALEGRQPEKGKTLQEWSKLGDYFALAVSHLADRIAF